MGGITLKDIAEEVDARHSKAFDPLGLPADLTLDSMGSHKMRSAGRGTPLQSPDHPYAAGGHKRMADYEMF